MKRPRLRHKTKGEIQIPACESLRKDRPVMDRMLGALLRGVSTREYVEVLPKMAETVGVSRSSVSRQAVEACSEQLKLLQERRWEHVEVLIIYIDGQRFGEHQGIEPGATENAAAVRRLLVHQDVGFFQ
ncbi:MAG: transposase [Bryobacterales bacterium]|nr:transposase [Bryobacterales bacterium]